VNRGLARSGHRRTNAGARFGRKRERESGSVGTNGQAPAKAQGGVIAPSSGRHTRESGRAGRGTGARKGNRILRRVPVDGRHPRSSRAIVCHEAAVTVILAAFSRPPSSAKAGDAHRRRPDGGRRKRTRRQGCQRLDRRGAVGRKCPRPRPGRKAISGRKPPFAIRQSGSDVVKHPVPRSSRAEPRLRGAPTQ